mmetsp:Transcript_30808/g.87136  ORF Transcript_30808/g.87136 Transcript_30808/m.87136 type:complete len:205 (+) Transcript_30808:388-1002(+)
MLAALTGRLEVACSRLVKSEMRSRTHCSFWSSHWARLCTFCTSSGGTNASMTRFLSAIWCVSIRMESSMSSLSRCSSSLMSSTSRFTCWNFAHSFFSFLPFCSASCCRLPYVSSLASCSSSSLASLSWFSRAFACRSSSSMRCFSSSSAVSFTTSCSPPDFFSPILIFDSIAISFLWSASFFSASSRAFSWAAALSSPLAAASL